MISTIENISVFNALYFLVFTILWLIGYGVAQFFLPSTLKGYSALLAPIWGIVLIIAVLTPLSLLGIPLKYVNWLIFFAAIAFGLCRSAYIANEKGGGYHSKRQQIQLIVFALGLGAIGGSIVIFISPHISYDDARGSTDLLDYWTVADYTNHFGGRLADYIKQSTFHDKVIEQHLTVGARWGTMIFLSFFSSIVSIENIYILINPIILASKTALILFFIVAALRSRVPAYPVLISLSVISLTYSNLYFTYLSYAVALPVGALCAWTINIVLLDVAPTRVRALIGIGLLISVSLISHAVGFSSLCFAIGLLSLQYLYHNKNRLGSVIASAGKNVTLIGLVVLPYAVLYGGQVIDVLRDTGKPANIGWLWARLPMPQDLLGLGNTLGFDQLGPHYPFPIQAILACVIVFLCWKCMGRLYGGMTFVAFIIFALALLPKYFVEYYRDENPLASHIIAKMIFSFSDFLIFLMVVGGLQLYQEIKWRRFFGLLFSSWALGALAFIFLTTPMPIFYERELIDLLRSYRGSAVFFVTTPELDALNQQYRFQPILQNDNQRIVDFEQLRSLRDCNSPLLFLWKNPEEVHGKIISNRGNYNLGIPPSTLDFTRSSGTISLISGFNYWQHDFRLLASSASLVLKPVISSPMSGNDFQLRLLASTMQNGIDNSVVQPPIKITATINRDFQIPFELHSGDNDILLAVPKKVISTCESYTFVEFQTTGSPPTGDHANQFAWGLKYIDLSPIQ